MEKAKTLKTEEAQQRPAYYVRPDEPPDEYIPKFATVAAGPGPAPDTSDPDQELPALTCTDICPVITCVGDWVVIERDHLQTTIATTEGYGELPTGTVVGIPPNSGLKFGDHVYFCDRTVTQKVQHPAYGPDKNLIILQEKHVFFIISRPDEPT